MEGDTASNTPPPEHGYNEDNVGTQNQLNTLGGENDNAPLMNNQNLLVIQHMTGILQNAMAQMEELMNSKLAAFSPSAPSTKEKEKEKVNDKSTEGETSHKRSNRPDFKAFRSCGATEFSGKVDPVEAYEWLDSMETTFNRSRCWEEDKVWFGTGMLTKSAQTWWNTTRGFMTPEEISALTWAGFIEKFLEQYCPPDLQRKYAREFLELKQGNMTVQEYESEFLKKAKFATQYLVSEKERVSRFIEGLRHEIQEIVEVRDVTSLAKAVEYARSRELTLSRRGSAIMPPPKRPFHGSHSVAPSFSRPSRFSGHSRSHSHMSFPSRSHAGSQA